MMKLALALLAVLAIIGLGHAHQVPDFGKGPLHEDFQDILDLIPMQKIADVFLDYLKKDSEVKDSAKFLNSTTVLKDLMTEVQAIPEVIKFFNFLQDEGIYIYDIMNGINKALGIKRLEPPTTFYALPMLMKRTGGVAGLFEDVKNLFNYDDLTRMYVHKLKTSPAFGRFVNHLKSDNFQQVVNKVYSTKPFQTILNGLKRSGVNVQLVADILFILFGINVPKHPLPPNPKRTLADELGDFVKLIPMEKFMEITQEYVTKDEKIQNIIKFVKSPEYHTLVRNMEALKEHQAVVVYIQKTGLDIIEAIKAYHKVIGMEDYVPPKIDNMYFSEIGVQKIGDGMRGMLGDLLQIMPVDMFQALYYRKMKTSKVFSEFVAKMKSPELKKLIKALAAQPAFKELVTKSEAAGVDWKALREFYRKLLPITFVEKY